jgi:PAS domain S-box-containing protein
VLGPLSHDGVKARRVKADSGRSRACIVTAKGYFFPSKHAVDHSMHGEYSASVRKIAFAIPIRSRLPPLHQLQGKIMASLESILGGQAESIALLKVLAENSFDSVLVTDATSQGNIIYANKAFKKLTGHDPKSVIGKTPRILQGTGTDKKVIERLAKALKSGGRFEGKAINYKKDGTPFIMFWRVLPIKVGKKIIAWVAIQRDGAAI